MTDVQVTIAGKDRKVGAMVKALAVEIAGFQAVAGTRREFLELNGFYVFHFQSDSQANQFRSDVRQYILPNLAQVS